MIGGDLLKGLAATDRLHGDLGFKLWVVGASGAHCWKAHGWGGAPPQRLTMDPAQKSQTTSVWLAEPVAKTRSTGTGYQPSSGTVERS
jgi:hypothetical protein